MPPNTLHDLETKYDAFYVPSFEIDVGGVTQFSPATGQASSLRVQTALEKANRVSFSVAGVYDQAEATFTGLDDAGLEIGNDLEVKIGYGGAIETIMMGKITDVKPNFPAGRAPTVDVVGHDHRYQMDQASGDASWDDTTVESATQSIADKYEFERVEIGTSEPGEEDGAVTEQKLKQLVKDAESDLAFLKQLITTHNYEMFSHAGVLWFRRPPKMEDSHDATIALAYGQGLRSFQRQGGGAGSQANTVTHRGVNPRTGEAVSGSTTRSGSRGADEERLLKAPMESDHEAEERSASVANAFDHRLRSSATTLGLPDLSIGDWVELTGLGGLGGQTYDGTYYLQEVNHVIDDSGYTTELALSGPSPESSP